MAGLFIPMFAGCSGGPLVTVTNNSSGTISNVVVFGHTYTNEIGTMAPGEARRVEVHPRGEATVRLVRESGGKKFDSGGLAYIEESSLYKVAINVRTNLEVEFSSATIGY